MGRVILMLGLLVRLLSGGIARFGHKGWEGCKYSFWSLGGDP